MKINGIVRKLDTLGRIVIPSELRKALSMKDGQELEMVLVEDGILIKVNNYDDDKGLESYTKEELIQELFKRI